jgi:DNA polymerase III sliding clamp (beta) subunit (PCNA family)
MITITDKLEIERVLYVTAAVSTDKGANPALKTLCIEPEGEVSRVAGTDGHRAHWAELFNVYAPGCYEFVKKSKTKIILRKVDAQFPDYRCCIPAGAGEEIQVEPGAAAFRAYTRLVRAMSEDMTLDYKYFSEAVLFADTITIMPDKMHPLKFAGNGTGAIVMPHRV